MADKKKKKTVLQRIKDRIENKKNVSPVSGITRAAREREKFYEQFK